MPIPKTRNDLIDQIKSSYLKLDATLNKLTEQSAEAVCVEDWSVKQLLVVRIWWSNSVVDWIESGRNGETPDLPTKGYKWNETPRLNNDIAKSASNQSFEQVRKQLDMTYRRVLKTIENLSDEELLEHGVFDWAGKWPLSRWLSINTARQYTTAQIYIRRVLEK